MDLRKWERSLKAAMAGFALGFAVLAVWKRIDWARRPEYYCQFSAPWYVYLLPAAALAAALIALAAIALVLVRRRRRKQEKRP